MSPQKKTVIKYYVISSIHVTIWSKHVTICSINSTLYIWKISFFTFTNHFYQPHYLLPHILDNINTTATLHKINPHYILDDEVKNISEVVQNVGEFVCLKYMPSRHVYPWNSIMIIDTTSTKCLYLLLNPHTWHKAENIFLRKHCYFFTESDIANLFKCLAPFLIFYFVPLKHALYITKLMRSSYVTQWILIHIASKNSWIILRMNLDP